MLDVRKNFPQNSCIVFTDGSKEYIFDLLKIFNKMDISHVLLIGNKSNEKDIIKNVNKIRNHIEKVKVETIVLDLNCESFRSDGLIIENSIRSQLERKNISIVVFNSLYLMNKQFTKFQTEDIIKLILHNFSIELKILSLLKEQIKENNNDDNITLIHFDGLLSKFKLQRIQLFSACRLALTDILDKERENNYFKISSVLDFYETEKVAIDIINFEHLKLKQFNWLSFKHRFLMSIINSGQMIGYFEKQIISNFYTNYIR